MPWSSPKPRSWSPLVCCYRCRCRWRRERPRRQCRSGWRLAGPLDSSRASRSALLCFSRRPSGKRPVRAGSVQKGLTADLLRGARAGQAGRGRGLDLGAVLALALVVGSLASGRGARGQQALQSARGDLADEAGDVLSGGQANEGGDEEGLDLHFGEFKGMRRIRRESRSESDEQKKTTGQEGKQRGRWRVNVSVRDGRESERQQEEKRGESRVQVVSTLDAVAIHSRRDGLDVSDATGQQSPEWLSLGPTYRPGT